MDSLKSLILSNALRDAVKQAVQEAVAEANALDLPKAYDPDFSQMQSTIPLAREQNASAPDQIAPVNPTNRR